MKKVILYGPLSPKVEGGFERMNNNIAASFVGDPDVFLIRFPMMKMKCKGNLKIILYPFFLVASTLRDLFIISKLRFIEKPDIFHVTPQRGILMYRDNLVMLAAKFLGLKIIYDIRTGRFISVYQGSRMKFIFHSCFRAADTILVEGEKYLAFLRQLGYEAKYFPNYTEVKPDIEIKKFTGLGQVHFIYVGRIIRAKGIDDSIAVLKILHEEYGTDLHFTIVGSYEEEYVQNLRRIFGQFMDAVSFIGYREKKEIDELLLNADFFMFLSTWNGEGHSNSVNEAMSAGLPIFYYDQGFSREIINNDRYLLAKDDPPGNARRIFSLLADVEAVNRERERLRSLAVEKYSLNEMKPYLKNIYLSMPPR